QSSPKLTSCRISSSRGDEAAAGEERRARRECRERGRSCRNVGEAVARRGESIDAEQLFRRKNKMATYNVTYRRWAESYDRSAARRSALDRRERLATERDGDLRRQRAAQEFQKWIRSHAPRSTDAAATSTLLGGGDGGGGAGAGGGLGPRSSYRERASSASPLRHATTETRRKAWTADGLEREVGGSG
ncbi:unnamed protein product, partial [Hapterophycus canaliculatus]